MGSVLGNRIRGTREKKDISQIRLAEAIGISNVQLSRYETGDRKPDPDTLKQIADFLQVSTDYLLGRTDEPGMLIKEESDGYFAFSDGGEDWTEEEFEYAKAAVEALRKLRGKDKK